MYDLVAQAGSTQAEGVRPRREGSYGDLAGLASGGGQAGAYRFRRRSADLGCRDLIAAGYPDGNDCDALLSDPAFSMAGWTITGASPVARVVRNPD
jgi:hypothetical protein